jgi:hypothetical protein
VVCGSVVSGHSHDCREAEPESYSTRIAFRFGRCDRSVQRDDTNSPSVVRIEAGTPLLARALDSRMPDTAAPHPPCGNSRPRHQAANPRLEPRRSDTGTARWFGQAVRVVAVYEPPLAPLREAPHLF